MSGVAAIYHRDGQPVDRIQLRRLIATMAWRGGDQQGEWIGDAAGLAAVQLWTTHEEEGSEQPLAGPAGRRIVFDGRLDNRVELAQALNIPAGELPCLSDAAVLLRAYACWGDECVDHIAGAFACLIWDAPRRRLFAARDPIGLRSLFYHWDGAHFYAASTIQQLRALALFPATLNDDYLWDYLTTTFTASFDLAATPFREVQRLPGGHRLSVDASGLKVERYWRPWELSPVFYKRDAEYADHFRDVLELVVQAACRANGPVGVALSGGLDSSSIACVGRELERAGRLPADALHTFTLFWEKPVHSRTGYADGEYAAAVNAKYAGPAHSVVCDGMTMFDQVPHRGPVPQDEPYFHIYSTWRYLQQRVRQAGVPVLLTGVGADEGLGGSLFFIVDWLRQGRVREALQTVKYISEVTPYNYGQVLLNVLLSSVAPRSVAYRFHELQRGRFKLNVSGRFHLRVPPWLPERRRLEGRGLARHRLIPRNFATFSTQAQFEAAVLLAGDNSRLWSDQYLGLVAGVDQRHPYLDRRMLEFLMRIPTIQKVGHRGERKYVLRQAMTGILPEVVRCRNGNTDYGFVFREGLNRHWPSFQAMFRDSRAAAAGYIDARAYLKELEAKRLGGGETPDADVAPTLGLEFWLREIEAPPSTG